MCVLYVLLMLTNVVLVIQVADCFIYAVLAWYFSQVWPSKVGTAKSPLFFLTRAYWDPQSQVTTQPPNHPR
jgi:hypothetical protein